jgi:hypothetical protein
MAIFHALLLLVQCHLFFAFLHYTHLRRSLHQSFNGNEDRKDTRIINPENIEDNTDDLFSSFNSDKDDIFNDAEEIIEQENPFKSLIPTINTIFDRINYLFIKAKNSFAMFTLDANVKKFLQLQHKSRLKWKTKIKPSVGTALDQPDTSLEKFDDIIEDSGTKGDISDVESVQALIRRKIKRNEPLMEVLGSPVRSSVPFASSASSITINGRIDKRVEINYIMTGPKQVLQVIVSAKLSDAQKVTLLSAMLVLPNQTTVSLT